MCEHQGPEDWSYRLDPAHREKVCRYLRRKYVSLSEEDIEDVWAEAHKELLEKPPADRNGPDKSIGGLLFTIADRRACDLVRRAETRGRTLKKCQDKARVDAGPEGEANAQKVCDPLEFAELQEIVIEAFDQLDPDQWLVLSVYCDEYPDLRGPTRLLRALTLKAPELARRGWTPKTVSRLLDRAREIVRKELRKKGYDRDCKS